MKPTKLFRLVPAFGIACLPWSFFGCKQTPGDGSGAPSASSHVSLPAQRLSDEEAAQILARVGTKAITLGDFAAGLERMDRFERLRYESTDRRKLLLDELIDLELLAQEARAQKLDESPEYRMRLDRALRDEVLADLRSQQPTPEAIPLADVRSYFESHKAEYKEPERRRASAIVVRTEDKAQTLLEQAKTADPVGFGQLVRRYSIRKSDDETGPLELEGDLGIVSSQVDLKSKEPRLPEPVHHALFLIGKVGDVYDKPVRAGDSYYVLRMTGRTEARERSFAEAERSIRVRMVDERIEQAERRLIEQLRTNTAVTIDEAALAKLRLHDSKRQEKLGDAIRH